MKVPFLIMNATEHFLQTKKYKLIIMSKKEYTLSTQYSLTSKTQLNIQCCDGDECRYSNCFSSLVIEQKTELSQRSLLVFYHIICHFQSHPYPLPHSLLRHHSRPHQDRNHHRRNLSCRCCRLWKVSSWV